MIDQHWLQNKTLSNSPNAQQTCLGHCTLMPQWSLQKATAIAVLEQIERVQQSSNQPVKVMTMAIALATTENINNEDIKKTVNWWSWRLQWQQWQQWKQWQKLQDQAATSRPSTNVTNGISCNDTKQQAKYQASQWWHRVNGKGSWLCGNSPASGDSNTATTETSLLCSGMASVLAWAVTSVRQQWWRKCQQQGCVGEKVWHKGYNQLAASCSIMAYALTVSR